MERISELGEKSKQLLVKHLPCTSLEISRSNTYFGPAMRNTARKERFSVYNRQHMSKSSHFFKKHFGN